MGTCNMSTGKMKPMYIYIQRERERERDVCVNTRIDVWNMKNEDMKHKHGTRNVKNGNMKNANTKCENVKKHIRRKKNENM